METHDNKYVIIETEEGKKEAILLPNSIDLDGFISSLSSKVVSYGHFNTYIGEDYQGVIKLAIACYGANTAFELPTDDDFDFVPILELLGQINKSEVVMFEHQKHGRDNWRAYQPLN